MRTQLAALALVVAAVFNLTARDVGAQVVIGGTPPAVVVGAPGADNQIGAFGGPVSPYLPAMVAPYSYYAAFPLPAREYVGFGGNDFPFHGQPYGHPYDLWTWPYLGRTHYTAVVGTGISAPW